MPLYSKGLLHGILVVFFMFQKMTHFDEGIPILERPWTKLQDLLLRCYLSTSKDTDCQYLRQVSQWIHDLYSGHNWTTMLDYVLVDDDDARQVVNAYTTLLTPPIPLSLAPIMLFDMSITLFRWLYYMPTNPKSKRPALIELLSIVAKAAFERLWLELDREWDDPMPARRRPFTRMYNSGTFQCNDEQSREALFKVFIDIEMYSLVGRLLMFYSRETEQKPGT
ncbi:unnamed protein product [Rhizoctonia solani]|uniref:Uncharacterized protein n=1 Tax=Rhizoctonia solani TaxID=456999 RepID=A0A8H3BRV4_9AGAM|nr:unnamed protein product [Rhizoctonia solani]